MANRKLEQRIFAFQSGISKCPKLIYQSDSYRLEEFYSGRTLTIFELRNDLIIERTAKLICEFNWDPELRKIAQEELGPPSSNRFLDKYLNQYGPELKSKFEVLKQTTKDGEWDDDRYNLLLEFEKVFLYEGSFEYFRSLLDSQDTLVLAHNDLQECNLLASDLNNLNFILIDYEFLGW